MSKPIVMNSSNINILGEPCRNRLNTYVSKAFCKVTSETISPKSVVQRVTSDAKRKCRKKFFLHSIALVEAYYPKLIGVRG